MQCCNATKIKFWDPLNIFRCPTDRNHAVIVLNRPIKLGYETVFPLWKKAKITITVDGGTNRWISYIGEERAQQLLLGKCKDYMPMLVTGDMDSISPNLLESLEKTEAIVIRTPDQNHTDYTKALMQLKIFATENKIHLNDIYVLADTSGRFDHIIANINTLHRVEHLLGPDIRVMQVAENSLTWLLTPGTHKILIPEALLAHKSWCALIPFANGSQVTTSGLQWNLEKSMIKIGRLISTSNTYNGEPEVSIMTSNSITWSMGIEPFTKLYKNHNK